MGLWVRAFIKLRASFLNGFMCSYERVVRGVGCAYLCGCWICFWGAFHRRPRAGGVNPHDEEDEEEDDDDDDHGVVDGEPPMVDKLRNTGGMLNLINSSSLPVGHREL